MRHSKQDINLREMAMETNNKVNETQLENAAIVDAEIVDEVVVASSVVTKTPVHDRFFKRMICKECGKEAYFMPTHNTIVCMECKAIPVVSSTTRMPEDYLSPTGKKIMADADKAGNKYHIVYRRPDSDPKMEYPGRNEECLCGSGKKFKKCCLPTFEDQRNAAAENMFEEKKEDAIITTANTTRLVNMVREYFQDNPDEMEIASSELGYKPFKNIVGEFADVDVLSVQVV